jgi:hypothetical protein
MNGTVSAGHLSRYWPGKTGVEFLGLGFGHKNTDPGGGVGAGWDLYTGLTIKLIGHKAEGPEEKKGKPIVGFFWAQGMFQEITGL